MTGRFAAAHATEPDWRQATTVALERLGAPPAGANLGFLYVTDHHAQHYGEIREALQQATGIAQWSGTVGLGIATPAGEVFDRPGIGLLVGAFPEQAFRLFGPLEGEPDGLLAAERPWLERQLATVAVVQADARTPDLPALLADFTQTAQAFAVGGLTAARRPVAGVTGGLSGVLFAGDVALVSGLTQGCQPLGEPGRITAAEQNVIIEIDGRRALDVLIEVVDRHFGGNLGEAWPVLHPGFPLPGRDTGDYLVRNFTGIDPQRGLVGVGELVEPGQQILFCRRDLAAARHDLDRMLRDVARRAGGKPQAGLYFSCVARGPNLFAGEGGEGALLRESLGDLPLAGFYAGGEISGDRLYGYTGVLALFL